MNDHHEPSRHIISAEDALKTDHLAVAQAEATLAVAELLVLIVDFLAARDERERFNN